MANGSSSMTLSYHRSASPRVDSLRRSTSARTCAILPLDAALVATAARSVASRVAATADANSVADAPSSASACASTASASALPTKLNREEAAPLWKANPSVGAQF
eukprot:2079750-Prymnesium_polylepis.1